MADETDASFRTSSWFILDDTTKQQDGPFSLDDLQDMLDEGSISQDTLVFREKQTHAAQEQQWTKLLQIPRLHNYLLANNATTTATLDKELLDFEAEIEKTEQALDEQKIEQATMPTAAPAIPQIFEKDGKKYKFDMTKNTYIYNDAETGVDMEYDYLRRAWVPSIDTTVLNQEEAKKLEQEQEQQKQQQQEQGNKKKRKRKEKLTDAEKRQRLEQVIAEKTEQAKEIELQKLQPKVIRNTSIYVTGLPLDITMEEFMQYFNNLGVYKFDPDSGQPKVKLYKDEQTGLQVGAGRITFAREESVQNAINYFHNSEIRPGYKIAIELAQFEMKGKVESKPLQPQKKGKKRKRSKEHKMLSWSLNADRDRVITGTAANKPANTTVEHNHVVILKHMFTPDQFAEDPLLKNELKEDILAECEKMGPVEKIRIFDNNPDGIVQIRFKDPQDAQSCIKAMHGRYFDLRTVEAFPYDGHTDYNVAETHEEQMKRFEKFSAETEEQ